MSGRSFFDSNVLIYADDDSEPEKQQVSMQLFATHRMKRSGVVSLQVLQEYFVVATCKMGQDAQKARRKVELFAELDVVKPDVEDIISAIDLHRLHGMSFWDALILRAAELGGCTVLFSENFQDQRRVSGLRIINPFR